MHELHFCVALCTQILVVVLSGQASRRGLILSLGQVSYGEQLEAGWARRGKGSSFRRNLEVWRFGFKSVLKVRSKDIESLVVNLRCFG